MRAPRARGHAGLRVAGGAVYLGGVRRRDVAARAGEGDRVAASAHHRRPHRVFRSRVYREERMDERDADGSAPAVRVTLQTRAGIVGSAGILDDDSDAGVVRDHAVLRLAMAGVAAALREVDVWVLEPRVGGLRGVARLAVSEVRPAGDGKGRSGEVGRIQRRRAAAVDVDALEEVVR